MDRFGRSITRDETGQSAQEWVRCPTTPGGHHHIAVAIPTNGFARFWIDGIGDLSQGHVAAFDRVLSEAEVRALYEAVPPFAPSDQGSKETSTVEKLDASP